jgi:phosphoenolpyruvate phosphomutase
MTQLASLLLENKSILATGIFNGLTAKLVQNHGFKAAWVSGFSVTASKGIPDANIIDIYSYINCIEEIRKASTLSLIVDCDEGHGSLENAVYLAKRLYSIGVEAICMEDNLYPKTNSFKSIGIRQIECEKIFANKIKAIKEEVPGLIVIGRTEAIVAGMKVEDAIRRGNLYAANGADLIMLHSTYSNYAQFKQLSDKWTGEVPLAVVPTNAQSLCFNDFEEMGYKLVIYANQLLRSATYSMKSTLEGIKKGKQVQELSMNSVTMDEIFKLTEQEQSVES